MKNLVLNDDLEESRNQGCGTDGTENLDGMMTSFEWKNILARN